MTPTSPDSRPAGESRSLEDLVERVMRRVLAGLARPRPTREPLLILQPTCQTCRAWSLVSADGQGGLCRRAPRAGDAPWPYTLPDEWCEAYEPPDLGLVLYVWAREPDRWTQPCAACDGTGIRLEAPCAACEGRGRVLTPLGVWLAALAKAVLPHVAPEALTSPEAS